MAASKIWARRSKSDGSTEVCGMAGTMNERSFIVKSPSRSGGLQTADLIQTAVCKPPLLEGLTCFRPSGLLDSVKSAPPKELVFDPHIVAHFPPSRRYLV